ncbi:MAG: CoA-binding protein [Candidatus Abyssobacteria bacterium SURF_17]|uniref:CoA-binding protein n=1 Tax=Candidatus Abyssobacteria bacterium SURF_17 TaxID=2093361 RepID=A0A419EWX9_9BACT|nr:MAG: CoA-binding protein [Candidatus Abyssubacteria bacterium SURF_17]
MPSEYEKFWNNSSYAIVGHSAKMSFPKLTYRALKKSGKNVFPVDPSADTIEGDKAHRDLASLPEKVEAVVIETPKEETQDWIAKAADAGIQNVWIHMDCEMPEALRLAKEKGQTVLHGTCAVMYVTPGFSFHSIHKWISKLLGKY